MANGTETQKTYTRAIIIAITFLGALAIVCGSALIWKGYNGDLLIGGGLAAISGLCGFIGANKPHTPSDVTISSSVDKTTKPEVTINQ